MVNKIKFQWRRTTSNIERTIGRKETTKCGECGQRKVSAKLQKMGNKPLSEGQRPYIFWRKSIPPFGEIYLGRTTAVGLSPPFFCLVQKGAKMRQWGGCSSKWGQILYIHSTKANNKPFGKGTNVAHSTIIVYYFWENWK